MRRGPSGSSPAIALSAITASALAYALFPIFPVVFAAAALHAAASCVLGPVHRGAQPRPRRLCGDRRAARPQRALRLDRQRHRGRRDGRDAATIFSAHAVFFVTAALLIPTLFALSRIQPHEINVQLAHGGDSRGKSGKPPNRLPQPAAPAAAVHPRRLHRAVPSGQRRDAAADGKRADDPFERMGDGADRRLHRGAAGRRRADLALGRASGRDLGAALVSARGIRRAGGARAAVRDRHRPGRAGRRAAARRHHRGLRSASWCR